MPDTPLERLPVSAVAFALGVSVARAKGRVPGQIAALCAELRRRGVMPDLLAALDPELARSVAMFEATDRMQAKARTRPRR